MSKYNYSWSYNNTPLSVRGGIKPGNKQGPFASTWWGKKWINTLESFNMGQRLKKGKMYARTGQVMEIEIKQDRIIAMVQGSRRTPYEVIIELDTWSDNTKDKVLDIICSNGPILGYILAGDIPYELEDLLKKQEIYLFPHSYKEIHTFCTCPDWSNPCKHIAAVFYLIASELDHNPGIIFKLRGLDIRQLREMIYNPKNRDHKIFDDKNIEDVQEEMILNVLEKYKKNYGETGKRQLKNFWEVKQGDLRFKAPFSPPPIHASVVKRLGIPPFWRGNTDFISHMEKNYSIISSWAIDKLAEQPLKTEKLKQTND